ncbi:ABC transporter substrate-binding protein [Amycolatopsis pithecellobii]|nr:ABC transporter substrate-binding protein [Amycolatopsis pithecellobii]
MATLHWRKTGAGPSRAVAVGLVALTALTLAGCADGGSGSGSGDLKIAVIADLTGPQTALGLGSPGVLAAVDEINQDGGINGRKVTVVGPFDAQSTADGGGTAAQQALSETPDVVIESTSSAGVAASLPVFANSSIPVIDLSGPQEAVTPPIPLHYSLNLEAGQVSRTLLSGSRVVSGVPQTDRMKVAVVGLATPAIDSYLKKIQADAAGANVDLTSVVRTEITQTSFSSQAAALVKDAPDTVLLIDSVAGTVLEAKALNTAGFKGQIIATHGVAQESSFAKVAAANYSAVRLGAVATAGSPLADAAKAKGVQAQAQDTSYFAQGWAAAYTAAAILQKCGASCSPEGFQAAAEGAGPINVPADAMYGPITFTPDKHYGLTAVQLYRWDSQSQKPVAVGTPTQVG